MPAYDAKTVMSRYGKLLDVPAADEGDESDDQTPCVVDPALMRSEKELGCNNEAGCDACCMSVVATVAEANAETTLKFNIVDTCAMSHTMQAPKAPKGHES